MVWKFIKEKTEKLIAFLWQNCNSSLTTEFSLNITYALNVCSSSALLHITLTAAVGCFASSIIEHYTILKQKTTKF